MSAQAVASVLPELTDDATSVAPTDQVEVTTFAQSTTSDSTTSTLSPTTEAAQIGASYGLDGTGQTIAIIDTGIAFDHIALGGGFGEGYKVVGGYDFAEGDDNPYDDGSTGFHGTHVAGIVGSDDLQYTGVASGADLVALRVFDDSGATELEWIEQSLQWVHDNLNTFENPITTVNLSLGTSPNEVFLESLNDELQQLEDDGVFISVAAGNSFGVDGAAELAYPASSEFVVPVASYGSDGEISDFSQRASNVLVAPGENITSTVPDALFYGSRTDSFLATSGTSQSAPYVAGASAVLREAYLSVGITDIDQDLLYDQFVSTADSIYDSVTQQSYYQINLEAAIESVINGSGELPSSQSASTVSNNATSTQTNQTDQNVEVSQTSTALGIVELDQGDLTISGTSADDSVVVTSNDNETVSVSINGLSQQFNLSEVDKIVFSGGQGDDSLEVNLEGTDDQVMFLQNRIDIRNQQFTLIGHGIEEAVVDNGDGNDSLYVEGSQFDDVVKASGKSVLYSNEEFSAQGGAFQTAYVLGDVGSDVIEFEGSEEEDRFSQSEGRTYFRSEQLELIAKGFENIAADGNGGADVANLIGTDAAETYNLNQSSGTVTGGTADANIEQFQQINVINTEANDEITLAGSAGDDTLQSKNNAALLVGENFTNYVSNASNVTVTESSGNDTANLSGSDGDDHLTHSGNSTSIENADGKITVEGFELVVGRSTGGNDTAEIVGSDQRELYFANENTIQSTARDGDIVRVVGFNETSVDGGGGDDVIAFRGDSSDETLRINLDDVEFETTLQMLRITNVESSSFTGGGGHDSVEINEVQNLDLLSSLGDGAEAVLRNHTATFSDVDEVEANAVDSAIAAYDLESVDFEYNLNGKWYDRDVLGI